MKGKIIIVCLALLGLSNATIATPTAPQPNDQQKSGQLTIEQRAAATRLTQDNAFDNPFKAIDKWLKHISITGQFDVDTVAALQLNNTNSHLSKDKKIYSGIGLNTAELYIDADLGDWLHIHGNLDASDAGNLKNVNDPDNTQRIIDDKKGFYNFKSQSANNISFMEATLQIHNFNKSPLWLRAGRQYLPFGDYKHDTPTEPLTEDLERINAVSMVGGLTTASGFTTDIYGYQDNKKRNDSNPHIRGYGADVSYMAVMNKTTSMNLHLGFISNMTLVDAINNSGFMNYQKQMKGLSVNADMIFGGFDVDVNGVTALNRSEDFKGGHSETNEKGERPWAVSTELGMFLDKQQAVKVGGGFQYGGDSALLGLPNWRVLGFVMWKPLKALSPKSDYADFFYTKFELDYNAAYKSSDYPNIDANSSYDGLVGIFRIGAKF